MCPPFSLSASKHVHLGWDPSAQACEALRFMHRDIKPENIMVSCSEGWGWEISQIETEQNMLCRLADAIRDCGNEPGWIPLQTTSWMVRDSTSHSPTSKRSLLGNPFLQFHVALVREAKRNGPS